MKLSEELLIIVNNRMKKLILVPILLLTMLMTPSAALAQGMMDNWGSSPSSITSDDHTAREEVEGKEIWEKLQAKQLECNNLTDEQYGSLGEYFMGQSIGNTQRHALMNQMMTNMMGEEGEEEMHVAMGKRMSGCEPDAAIPQSMMSSGMMQLMIGSGMMDNWLNSSAFNNYFTNPSSMFDFGFASFGWIFMILFWVLVIVGIVALIKWIANQNKNESR